MLKDTNKYEEWLTTIANTRLIYNSMDELEEMLDNHSIHNNGIKRSFPSQQKMRSAFRDLKVEVELMTDGFVHLDQMLLDYQRAWAFFRQNLYRRSNPEQIVLELLSYCYHPYHREGLGSKKQGVFEQVVESDINVPLLVLMLMKAMPGYDSKDGDVAEMPRQYERVMQLMESFVANSQMFNLMPAITRARDEEKKCRLMLYHHVSQILDTYESYTVPVGLYDMANAVKDSMVHLDIEGLWNECEGQLLYTNFWQIEDDDSKSGTYFVTHWHKDAENRLTGIRYIMIVIEGADGGLVYYMQHPEAIMHRMSGLTYGDTDQVWYRTQMLEDTPNELSLKRLMYSEVWPQEIKLSRCTDEAVIKQYNKWLHHDCEIVKPYQHLEYVFTPNLYAITQTHLYIPSEIEGEFYKVPKSAHEGFERIQLTDGVGIMRMDGKTYLAFDEFVLYIDTSQEELSKYGIERVKEID